MVRFAHIADCHLGGWRQEEIQKLNFESFKRVIHEVIEKKPDFILIAGDLFDSAYPPIEVLRDSFEVFKTIYDRKIPVYLIAGSHDFSASGKTFLDVLEKAGFCINVGKYVVEEDSRIRLIPTMHEDITIYGYPGKKSGMEVDDLKRVYIKEVSKNSIFMLHTTIKDVVGNIPMDSVEKEKLPIADYYAMGHIHRRFEVDYKFSKFVYPGPTFPCNFQELADLGHGSYCMVEFNNGKIKKESIEVPIRQRVLIEVEVDNSITATEKIIHAVDKHNLNGKIVLLRVFGTLKQGKIGDIKFQEIEDFIRKKQAFSVLRNISSIQVAGQDLFKWKKESEEIEDIEKSVLENYLKSNPSQFDNLMFAAMNVFSMEKREEEKSSSFEERLISELKNVFKINDLPK